MVATSWVRRLPRTDVAVNVSYLQRKDWWSRVAVTQSAEDCWLWKMSTGSHGYGQTWDGERVLLAHRVAWTLTHGPIEGDLTVDHVCRTRRCCNPSHLCLLSNIENATLNGNRVKTRCSNGHPFDDLNTWIDPGNGHRTCLTCRSINNAKRYTSGYHPASYVSQVDVAKVAGLSLNTVSRCLNGHSVSDRSREKIESALKDVGYEMHPALSGRATSV